MPHSLWRLRVTMRARAVTQEYAASASLPVLSRYPVSLALNVAAADAWTFMNEFRVLAAVMEAVAARDPVVSARNRARDSRSPLHRNAGGAF